jgi:hypothetical protein
MSKLRFVSAVVVVSSVFFSAFSQINLLSNDITFRNSATANHGTTHYGDLNLSGGDYGTSWGWLYCNQINNYGNSQFQGQSYFYNDVIIFGSFDVYNGTKNFIQPHPTDTNKVIRYIAIESGEALTIARGTAKTTGGIITVDLPEHFSLVTSDKAPVTVLLTPEKYPVLLYTKEKSKTSITVAVKNTDFADYGDVDFSYQVTGVRDGFEDQPVIVNASNIGKPQVVPADNKVKMRSEKLKKAMMQEIEKSAKEKR